VRWPASWHVRPGRAPCRGPEQRRCTHAEPLAPVRRTVRGARRRQLLATNNTVIPTVIFMGNNDYCEILDGDFVDVMYWCAAARASKLEGSTLLASSVQGSLRRSDALSTTPWLCHQLCLRRRLPGWSDILGKALHHLGPAELRARPSSAARSCSNLLLARQPRRGWWRHCVCAPWQPYPTLTLTRAVTRAAPAQEHVLHAEPGPAAGLR